MELEAILLARALAFVEPVDLNPQGQVFFPDLAKALIARYNFQVYPQKPEEVSQGKPVTFGMGRLGNTSIEELVFHPYGLTLSTRVSTAESKHLLEDAMQWGAKDLGLAVQPVLRWQYESQVTFTSEVSLTAVNPMAQVLASVLEKNAFEILGRRLKYELSSLLWEFDLLERKYTLGRFTIQRRENTPFSANKYFSDAPLPTDVHLRALEQFEAALSTPVGKPN